MEDKIRLGISSCLLGNKVRYDGQHSYENWLVEGLGRYVSYIPVCPEVECGLPIPRPAMHLVGNAENPHLIVIKDGTNLTEQMLTFCRKRVSELAKEQLCGFVFKSRSPSSGMERVKIYPENGGLPQKIGVGLFAREFMRAYPLLPVEEEGRLLDPQLRENFIERIFIMQRWLHMMNETPKLKDLINFHTRHKLLIMSHSNVHYKNMGKLIANASQSNVGVLFQTYLEMLMLATKQKSTPKKHQNVMLHILGYFKKDLSAEEKAEIIDIINKYKECNYPLIVPITLLNHYVRKYDKPYLAEQYYLNPHPVELNLRNHC
jgi:uncharacterized protein YbgA (DUF1722 family)/uncharacterized protein YbbK (DUF523 family)